MIAAKCAAVLCWTVMAFPLRSQMLTLTGISNPAEVVSGWSSSKAKQMTITADTRVFPLLANGPLMDGMFRSAVNFFNLTRQPVEVAIEFFDKAGNSMQVALEDSIGNSQGRFPGAYGRLDPYAGGAIRTYPFGEPYSEGWARIQSNPPSSVGANAVWAQIGSALPSFEALIPLTSNRETDVFLPFLNRDIYTTVVAASNDSNSNISALVIARTADGKELCRATFPFGPGQAGGGSLKDLMPCTNGQNGIIEVSTTANGIATLAYWVTTSQTVTIIPAIQR